MITGELGVVTQKLSLLKEEIAKTLLTIKNLTARVEGDITNRNNLIGTIHSPARPGPIYDSIEMFIGNYYIGDVSSLPNSKVGSFSFGKTSECFYYFMPSLPLHGVNRKYVDQSIEPLSKELVRMIKRNGDRVPLNPDDGSILTGTYIFKQDLTLRAPGERIKWLFDSRPTKLESEFIHINETDPLSRVWINVEDGRYYGNSNLDNSILNMQTLHSNYLSRVGSKASWLTIMGTAAELSNAALLFTNSQLILDSESDFTYDDKDRKYIDDGIKKKFIDSKGIEKQDNEPAIMKNVRDFTNSLVFTGSTDTMYFNTGLPSRVDWYGYINLDGLIFYWCKTEDIARIPLPVRNDDGGKNAEDPEYNIGLPLLFSRILNISIGFNNASTVANQSNGWQNDDDMALSIVDFKPTDITQFRIRYVWNLTGSSNAGLEDVSALCFIVGLAA